MQDRQDYTPSVRASAAFTAERSKTRAPSTRRPWTEAELQTLRLRYDQKIPVARIARELNRSEDSIVGRARYRSLPAAQAPAPTPEPDAPLHADESAKPWSQRRQKVRRIAISSLLFTALDLAAQDRDLDAERLINLLLRAIVDDGLIGAVLDIDHEAPRRRTATATPAEPSAPMVQGPMLNGCI